MPLVTLTEKPQFRVIKFREKNKDIYFIYERTKVIRVMLWIEYFYSCKYVFAPLNKRVFSNRNVYFGINYVFLKTKKNLSFSVYNE